MKFFSRHSESSKLLHLEQIVSFFTRHPRENGKTYLQHLYHAWSLSFEMARGSVALLIHGLIPEWFEHTGTSIISSLSHRLLKQA